MFVLLRAHWVGVMDWRQLTSSEQKPTSNQPNIRMIAQKLFSNKNIFFSLLDILLRSIRSDTHEFFIVPVLVGKILYFRLNRTSDGMVLDDNIEQFN